MGGCGREVFVVVGVLNLSWARSICCCRRVKSFVGAKYLFVGAKYLLLSAC